MVTTDCLLFESIFIDPTFEDDDNFGVVVVDVVEIIDDDDDDDDDDKEEEENEIDSFDGGVELKYPAFAENSAETR